jgi:hypothetical protein
MIRLYLTLTFCTIFTIATFSQNQRAQYREYLGTNAQGQHQYGPATNFPNVGVADDFGPRALGGDPYDWHGGIDFNSPDGVAAGDEFDLILAVEGGTISTTSGVSGNGFKWITIMGAHNISYEHILEVV